MECKKRTAFVKLLTWIEKKNERNGQTLEHLLHYPTQVVSILTNFGSKLFVKLNFEINFQDSLFMKTLHKK